MILFDASSDVLDNDSVLLLGRVYYRQLLAITSRDVSLGRQVMHEYLDMCGRALGGDVFSRSLLTQSVRNSSRCAVEKGWAS